MGKTNKLGHKIVHGSKKLSNKATVDTKRLRMLAFTNRKLVIYAIDYAERLVYWLPFMLSCSTSRVNKYRYM